MISELIPHLWQSTLFLGAGWLLTLALRNNQARVRYWVWLAVSIKFLVPFSLLVGFGMLMPRRLAVPPVPTHWVMILEQIGQPVATLPPLVSHVANSAANQNYFAAVAVVLWACGFAAIASCWLTRWKRAYKLRQ